MTTTLPVATLRSLQAKGRRDLSHLCLILSSLVTTDGGSVKDEATDGARDIDEDEPWDHDPLDQLPAVIEPGGVELTLWSSRFSESPMAYDVSFTWDGHRDAEWYCDISMINPGLSVMSSAPFRGTAAWPDGRDVAVTYCCDDMGLAGECTLAGVAPTADDPQSDAGMRQPQAWLDFAEAILDLTFDAMD